MLTPSPDILPWLAVFASAMTAPTFTNLLTLLCGTLLATGRRTVTAALQALGQEQGNFSRYHRVFNRAQWCPMQLARLLLDLLIRCFLAPDAPLEIVVDDTLERRRARRIAYRGLFRDPVRSTKETPQYAWGIRWLCFALLVPVPWSRRRWALPFLVVPVLSEKICQRLHKRHRSVVELAGALLAHVRRWHPTRDLILEADGTFATVPLARHCQSQPQPVRLVSRLRLNARLYDAPLAPPKGKRGRKPEKGAPQPTPTERLGDPATVWERVQVSWYGGAPKELEVATGVGLWKRRCIPPVWVRWVLVRSPAGDPDPIAPGGCFCTDVEATALQIVNWFVGRWNIEVTFAELRAHLGFETQRHWSARAVNRVIPCLFGLFSLVVVLAKQLHPERLPVRHSAWYPKEEATFADALAAVRRYLWRSLRPVGGAARSGPSENYLCSAEFQGVRLIPSVLWERLEQVACYAP